MDFLSAIVTDCLIKAQAVSIKNESPFFQLASGNYSPIYVNCRRLQGYTIFRERINDCLNLYVSTTFARFSLVAGCESAGVPWSAVLAERQKVPHCWVKKKPKGHGEQKLIEGLPDTFPSGWTVLLVDDLITDGGSKLHFIETLRKETTAHVDNCLVILDREQGGRAELDVHGVKLHAMTTLSQVLEMMGIYDMVAHYLADPKQWHLRQGLEWKA